MKFSLFCFYFVYSDKPHFLQNSLVPNLGTGYSKKRGIPQNEHFFLLNNKNLKTVPSLFHRIFSERNFDCNPISTNGAMFETFKQRHITCMGVIRTENAEGNWISFFVIFSRCSLLLVNIKGISNDDILYYTFHKNTRVIQYDIFDNI
jgi:hypothetical protein